MSTKEFKMRKGEKLSRNPNKPIIQYAPSSGGTREAISISIAIQCAEKIVSNIGFSVNDEYWVGVIKYLNNKR